MRNQFFLKSLTLGWVIGAIYFVSLPAQAQLQPTGSSIPTNQQVAQNPGTIVDVAAGNDDFDTLVQAVQTAGLADALSGPGPFTVFAPTNAAFEALTPGALDLLLQPENRDLLTDVLQYHVVSDELPSSELTTGTVDSLNGPLAVRVSPDGVTVNNVRVTTPDVEASNGVIHVIDRVLVPQETAAELLRRLAAQRQTTPATTRPAPAPEPQATPVTEPAAPPVRGLW